MIGNKVKVLTSHHSAIQAGEIGIITCRKDLGFGVTFTKIFPSCISNFRPKEEKRIIFFEASQLELSE